MPNNRITQLDINGTTYELEAVPLSHTHGNITNDGKIGSTTDYAVYTTTDGALIAGSLSTNDPTAAGTADYFISSVSQDSKGKISASKAGLPTASTTGFGITNLSQSTMNTLINQLSTDSNDPQNDDYYVAQYAGGSTTNTDYYRRPISKLFNYIKNKFQTNGTAHSPISEYGANTTVNLVASDAGKVVIIGTSSATASSTVQIPASTFAVGTEIEILRRTSGTVTIKVLDGTLYHTPAATGDITIYGRWGCVALKCIDATNNYWVAAGDIS